MAFRLGCPAITEERCRVCKMQGGITIETEHEARAFTRSMRAHPAVWTPRDMEPGPIRMRETIELEPCVGPEFERQTGRICPRVELLPENARAAQLVFAAIPEHTRGLLPVYAEALVSDLDPEEAAASIRRAMSALHSEFMADWFRARMAPPARSDP